MECCREEAEPFKISYNFQSQHKHLHPVFLARSCCSRCKNGIVVIRQLTIKSIVHEIPSEISCIAHNEKVGNKPTGSLFVKANMLLLLSHSLHEWPHSSQGGLGEP